MSLVLALVLVMPATSFATTTAPTNSVWGSTYLLQDPGSGFLSETSLRMHSLGLSAVGGSLVYGFKGLVEDEYTDLFLNPANITTIEGGRLYTNLANVQEPSPILPIDFDGGYHNSLGFVTDLAGNKVGVLLGQKLFSNDKTSSGSNEDKTTNPTTKYTWNNDPIDKDTDLKAKVWFGRKLSDSLTVGANVSLANSNSDSLNGGVYWIPGPLANVSYTHLIYTATDPTSGKVTLQKTLDYGSTTKNTEQGIKAQAGAKMALGSLGLSLSGTVQPISIDYSETTNDSTITEQLNGATGLMDKTTVKNSTVYTGKGNGTGLGLNTRLALPDDMLKNFGKVYIAANFDSASIPITGESSSSSSTEAPATTTKSSNKALYSGNLGKTGYNVGVGTEKELGENAKLLMGVRFDALNYNNKQTFGQTTGTDITGTPTNDYTTIERSLKQSDMSISIPVGLEAKVMPKLTLRLGADAVVYSSDSAVVTTTTTTTLSNGTVSKKTTQEQPKYYPSGTASSTMSSYSLGAGYEVNEKVQVDLLNYASYLSGAGFRPSTWAISATIRF